MKKILFVIPASYIAGTEKIMLSIMVGLKERGYLINCLVSGWSDGEFPKLLQEANIPLHSVKLGFVYIKKPLWTLDSLVHYPEAFIRVRLLLRAFTPDLIYHSSFRSLITLSPLIRKYPNILHVHDYPFATKANQFFYKLADRQAEFFIAVSGTIKKALEKIGVRSSKITMVFNGLTIPNRMSKPTDISHKQKIVIGIVGQIIPRKGHHVVIEALNLLRKKASFFYLNIYGHGDEVYIKQLKNLAKRYGLEDKINWMGFEDDQHKLYQSVDLVVVPTISPEPFGLVAIEPTLYGKLVIAAASGGLAEIVEHRKTGLSFEPGNAENLVAILNEVNSHRAEIPVMILKAQKQLETKFSSEKMLDKIESIILKTANK